MIAETKDKWLSLVIAIALGVGLWIAMSPVAYSEPVVTLAQAESVNGVVQLAQANFSTLAASPITDAEKARAKQVAESYLASQQRALPDVPTIQANINRVNFRVLRVTTAPTLKDAQAISGRLASVVTFDYLTNRARLLRLDVSSGQVVREQQLPGQPQISEEERAVATQIAQSNPEVASLLQAGNILENTGFIVSGPSPGSRYAQLKVLTPDSTRELKRVVVNLSSGAIASVFTPI